MTDETDLAMLVLKAAEDKLEALWEPGLDPLPLEDAVDLLLALQEHQKVIATYLTTVEDLVVNLMPEKTVQVRQGTLERVTSASKTTWDVPLLTQKIATTAIEQREVDPLTGELESPADAVCRALTDCVAVSYFRLGNLEKYGIEGRNYRSTEWGRKRVKITKSQASPPESPGVESGA